MLKILKYKDTDTLLDIVLVTFAKLVLAAALCAFAFYLAFASTMGPTIAPEIVVGDTPLDIVIRIGVLLTAVAITLFAVIWLVYPLLRYVYKKTIDDSNRE